ncbi:hypothetical protein HKX48_004694, partial [Thoreauomyces humboldtii]
MDGLGRRHVQASSGRTQASEPQDAHVEAKVKEATCLGHHNSEEAPPEARALLEEALHAL